MRRASARTARSGTSAVSAAQRALRALLERTPPLDPSRDGLQLVLTGVIGLLTGVVAWLLISGVHLVAGLAFSSPVPTWQIVVVPTLGGFVVGLLVHRVVPEVSGGGVVSTMEAMAIHRGRLRRRVPLAGVAATSVALGTGASGGREGPIVLFGGAVSAKEHADLAEQAARFLRGDVDSKVAELEYAMSEAAKKLRYETAARLRDKISAAKEVGQPLNVVWPTDESASLVAAVADGMRAAAVVFDVRKGRMAGRSTFLFDLSEALDHTHPRKKPDYPASSEDDTDDSGKTTCDTDVDDTRLRAVVDMALSARFDLDRPDLAGKDDPPPRMLIAHTSPSDGALELLTRARREAGYSAPVRVRVPRRGPARALLDTAMSNAEDALAVDRMRSGRLSAERMVALERMAAACGFDIIPRRIECYDISHFSGTGTVASLVVFVDGSPERSSYRNFTMSKEQNDDFLSMKEVITRRLTHLGGEDSALSSPPDLILVDGGAPQLAAAVEALEDFGIEGQNVASIAKKKEELWLPGRADPVPLERDSAPMLILRHLRDEAHRRAVSHQRKKREP